MDSPGRFEAAKKAPVEAAVMGVQHLSLRDNSQAAGDREAQPVGPSQLGNKPCTPPPSDQVLYQQTPANTPVRGFDGNDPAPQSEDGDGWNAILTPVAGHTLDVKLKHRWNFESEVTCVRFSPSGDLVALGCKRMASVYDTKTWNQLRDLDHDIEAYIYSVCFHHKEKLLATGDVEGTMRIWKVDDGTLTGSFHVDSRCHVSVDFARNDFAGKGDLLAFGSTDGNVRLWDVAQGKVVRTLEAEASINSVALSNNTKYVVAGLAGNLGVQVWDIDSGHVVAHFQGPKGHSRPVMSVAFSPDDVYVFTGSLDKTVKVWLLNVSRGGNASLESERCVRTYEGHEGFVTSVASMARWVLSGSADRKLSLWDPTTGTVEMKLDGHDPEPKKRAVHDPEPKKRAVSSVDGNPSNGLIVAGSTDTTACVWCVRERPTS